MTPSRLRIRYWRIVYFFALVTLHFMFWEIFLPKIGLRAWTRSSRSQRYQKIAQNFRALAIAMGGLMIKVGQFLSARLDVLPPEITDELSGLQDEVPAEPWDAIVRRAEGELGAPLLARFAWVDSEPMAAASLGQAHRARLLPAEAEKYGFSDVVLKVQRPEIEKVVEVDLSALRVVGQWLQKYKPVSDHANVPELVAEFSTMTYGEIDYRAEARNAEAFAENFKSKPRVHVPIVVWETTTTRVLTLENVFAIRIGDYAAITAAGIDRSAVATLLLESYMQQVFEDGFFHADPHPGNLFVTPLDGVDENGQRNWKLTFIDFGMVGRMPEHLRSGLREAMIALGTRDASRLIKAYQILGVLLPGANLKLIEQASAQVFERFWGKTMKELRQIDHAEVMRFGLQFRELIYQMPFQLPQNLLILGRTAAMLSGMSSGLNPDFNIWTFLAPYAARLVAEEGGSNWRTWLDEAGKMLQLLLALPGRTERVLGQLERGDLNIQMPVVNRQVYYLETAVNRLSGGLIFAALLVAGAIVNGSDPQLGRWLMGGSVLPLFWMLFGARGQRPWQP